MRFDNDEFMDFMGYRESLIEEKVEECLDAARHGATSITVDQGELMDDEFERVEDEVRKRLGKGNY